jgi:hypothetical protein
LTVLADADRGAPAICRGSVWLLEVLHSPYSSLVI